MRLVNEATEALERQTAIGEILRAIAGSPTDVQPVLKAITANAIRFCAAEDAFVMLPKGGVLRLAEHTGPVPTPSDLSYALDGTSMNATAFVESRVLHSTDIQADANRYPAGAAHGRKYGWRASLAAPLVREGSSIGTIALRRFDARPFTAQQIDLLRTFADQAVIAIENVRLFNETKESLERQTATGEVLRAISRTREDVGPVLETIVNGALRLCAAESACFFRRDGNDVVLDAVAGNSIGRSPGSRRPIDPQGIVGIAFRDRHLVHLPDAHADEQRARFAPQSSAAEWAAAVGMTRSRLAVPVLLVGAAIGVIRVERIEPGGFTERQVALVESFAAQAAIAIENVRLFNEIQETSRQLAAASRHKSEFLANMSHELRTPLNAIIGFSDVLEQRLFGALNERQADYTRDIGSSGRHLLDLVNEILDLSKVEAGRMELEPSEFALAETIRGALGFVRERAAGHRIELDALLPADLGTLVADERKVRQVLLNLLSNAVKFTPDGGRVAVRALRAAREVQVSVQDTGIGIAPEDQPRVFEEFRQVGMTSDRSREGTGLGLTLAKRFIELHGGRIWIDSEVGKGTTFTFAIPVGSAAPTPG